METGRCSGFAGRYGLAVAVAVGAFREGLAPALDLADVGFAFVGVSSDSEDGGAGGRDVEDEGDGLCFGVSAGQGERSGVVDFRPGPFGVGSAVAGAVVEVFEQSVGAVDLVAGGGEVLADRADLGAAGGAVLQEPGGFGLVG